MKQIVRVIQLFTDKIKSYIVVGLIVVLVPSLTMSQNLVPGQKTDEKLVPKVSPPTPAKTMPYGTIFMLNKPIACNDTPLVKSFIENVNGMIPVTMGTDRNAMGGITSLVQLYANPDTEKFAVVEHFAAQKSCIIFQGHDFDVILPERYYRGPNG